ncbi:glycerol dehydrogenase [Leptolyngbya sp. 'hensonii']|uniref:DUF3119 family protein n=1 Tax=Leptolyngbya sp. 'hensonii' TaxID=1922337 RepID=UPI000950076B|nr:DUF3119 family protein [Leptolyngbya sp. 'hensonii']OLP19222.1 glycerol dehydrogenase [Leptolyngbya sp. 'hensonii']
MTATTPTTASTEVVELAPSYAIPIVLALAALPIALLQVWIGAVMGLFGLFLMFQTVTLRLRLTETALDVYRSETLIRRFPYADWQNWVIFWDGFPVLFYFREVKSIHFLPILFDPKALRTALEKRIGH